LQAATVGASAATAAAPPAVCRNRRRLTCIGVPSLRDIQLRKALSSHTERIYGRVGIERAEITARAASNIYANISWATILLPGDAECQDLSGIVTKRADRGHNVPISGGRRT
jgi:hypothetical protein